MALVRSVRRRSLRSLTPSLSQSAATGLPSPARRGACGNLGVMSRRSSVRLHRPLSAAARLTGAAALAGAGTLAYAAGVEVRWFALRRATVPVLPPGHESLRV